MKEIVAVPAAHRPELLALCLEKLALAKDRPEVHIYADCVSESRLDEIETVRDLYLPEAALFRAKSHVAAYSGSWNILQSIKSAARFADTVYLVEEDVMIYPQTFFQWHRSQSTPASLGRRTNFGRFHEKHPNAYRNPGACLRRPLLDLLIPHICDAYYADQKEYCDAQGFPSDKYGPVDDGLICYVLEKAGMDVALPHKPVCAHQGFYYYGKLDIFALPDGNPGVLERLKAFKTMEQNILHGADPRFKRYATDFEPFLPG